jgi:hypothetical protein
MAKILIAAVIEIDEKLWDLNDPQELDDFMDEMNYKETFLILHSNDIGDQIGSTNDFTFKLID